MKSFIQSIILFAASVSAAPSTARAACHAEANVCLGPNGTGDCLPKPFNFGTCYDLPTEWLGQVRTLASLDDNAVCLAYFTSCAEAQQNTCHDSTADCTGYALISKENTHGWDLDSMMEWKQDLKAFGCWLNGTLPALPASVSSLAAPVATATATLAASM
ncbi:hypothetical protein F4778DRAFT_737760 [Xylariomycetidae sp. FL2044]|nr:hypothetical protein F4778DRAFT_737760 [Xylariomycetidae sp. FL2044]